MIRDQIWRRSILAAALLPTISVAVVSGQLVVGNDQPGNATIYHIDLTTGAAAAIYSSSLVDAKPWGMAYDAEANMLYWNNGSNLFQSPMGTALSPTLLGEMTYNNASINFVGMGFRDGKLLATRNLTAEAVYEIDTNTLEATRNYLYPTILDFGGYDVDVVSGNSYGVSDSGFGNFPMGLYEIDDAARRLYWKASYPAGETDIDGLAVYDGIAYYVTDGPNSSQSTFYMVDVETGQEVGKIPSPFTGDGTFAAAAFIAVPEPTACCLGGMLLVVSAMLLRSGFLTS